MRAVDPGIKLIADGVEGAGWDGWNRELCQIAGKHFDWLSVHHYFDVPGYRGDVLNYAMAVSDPARIERMLAETYDIARQAAGKEMPLAFDEWNATPGGSVYRLRDAVFAGLLFNAYSRLGQRVTMANIALLVNVLGVIRADHTNVVRTTMHQAFELYAPMTAGSSVPAEVEVRSFHFPEAGALPALDVVASLSEDGRTLYVAVVNRMPVDAVQTELSLGSFAAADLAEVRSLTAESYTAANTLETPEAVRVRTEAVPLQEALRREFPPHSLTVLRFGARQ